MTLSALQFLSHHPLTDLVLAGRFSKAALRLFRESADNLGVVLDINATPEPRLFTTKMVNGVAAAFEPNAGFANESEAFGACLAPSLGVRGALHWTQLWKHEASLPAMRSGLRKLDAFYSVARLLARTTASAVNWSEIGRLAQIPSVTILEWVKLLEKFALLDIVPAVNLKPQRRTLDRPKVYWRHPGLCLWLSGQMNCCPDTLRLALFENAVYLALCDISRDHFCALCRHKSRHLPSGCRHQRTIPGLLHLRERRTAGAFASPPQVSCENRTLSSPSWPDRVPRNDDPGADNIRGSCSRFSKAIKILLKGQTCERF